ncbi:uncharacterized protein LOC102802449 [Saccoglossus kowalevskii]|uniref:Uncharacterized protein LOC102802449 n=1 Tax=Saccoglossus kowalevskii TaxID=10224 RepID=A0ABM0MTL3_SACKO|nr:PREDICTED: uncharacterized protein LOC102802449 [Saccoglossus kowalevskii]
MWISAIPRATQLIQRRNKARAQLQAVLTPIEELITQYPDANDKNAAYREILARKLAVDNRLSALVNADQQVIDHYDEDHAEFTETESYEVEILARFARLSMFVEEFQTIRFQQPVIQQASLDHNMAALQPDQQTHYKSVRLPHLEMPTFHGDLLTWAEFIDNFKAAVHNDPRISDIQKFTYLRNYVDGEAKR